MELQLKCPIDNEDLQITNSITSCTSCGITFPNEIINGKTIKDLRCIGISTKKVLNFTVPSNPLQTGDVENFGLATKSDYEHMHREKVRKKFGSKLQKELFYYINKLKKDVGTDALILDLGCGDGGNTKYLKSLGFHNIVSVDYHSKGAEFLVDVHRMPFETESFDLIITTQTLEHFYNPFIAFQEMSRILKINGMLLASGSFWESWHGNSCFHFTPGGLSILCDFSKLKLIDIWSGWGFIASVSSHALGLKRFKRFTYMLQSIFYFVFKLLKGSKKTQRHIYNTAGSFGIFAVKREKTF
tara:strand:- start:5866 stop:6765 length:900 start_codon:yes stop_codon:yes gene_type:complete